MTGIELQAASSRFGARHPFPILMWEAIVTVALAVRLVSAQAASPKPLVVLEGKLLSTDARGPQLRVGEKVYPVGAASSSLLHTLSDQRLMLRDVRLEGTLKSDGKFEVTHLFTVKNGQLYKVRYYCNVCNITALEPGHCVCCQRPTELQEIPVSEVTPDMIVVP